MMKRHFSSNLMNILEDLELRDQLDIGNICNKLAKKFDNIPNHCLIGKVPYQKQLKKNLVRLTDSDLRFQ